ncbi:hypothetical protein D0869_03877, partial [Hortaea werneckii]
LHFNHNSHGQFTQCPYVPPTTSASALHLGVLSSDVATPPAHFATRPRDNILSTRCQCGRQSYAPKVGYLISSIVPSPNTTPFISPRIMAQLLDGRIAIITGAVTGIGRAIAVEYLKHGAKVAVNYFPDDKSTSQFQELQKEVGESAPLIAVAGDITKPETGQELVRKTVEKWGRVDIFVSNAGVCEFADFLTISPDLVDFTIKTNLNGAFF